MCICICIRMNVDDLIIQRRIKEYKALTVTRMCSYKKRTGLRPVLFLYEASAGFEPADQGVADPRLTAWLRRPVLSQVLKHNTPFQELLQLLFKEILWFQLDFILIHCVSAGLL